MITLQESQKTVSVVRVCITYNTLSVSRLQHFQWEHSNAIFCGDAGVFEGNINVQRWISVSNLARPNIWKVYENGQYPGAGLQQDFVLSGQASGNF